MNIKCLVIILLPILPAIPMNALADDEIFPPGFDFVSRYEVPAQIVRANDTFSITRTFINNETFPLTGLYLSDNLPHFDYFEIVDHDASINGLPINYMFYHELSQPTIENFEAYYWVVDSPKDYENIHNTINPGDSLHVEVDLAAHQMGSYLFPRHTIVFYGDGSGFFTTADSVYIEILYDCGNTNGTGIINLLDVTYLIQHLYRDGPEPLPLEAGDSNGDGTINLLDITYLIFFLYKGGPEPLCP